MKKYYLKINKRTHKAKVVSKLNKYDKILKAKDRPFRMIETNDKRIVDVLNFDELIRKAILFNYYQIEVNNIE